MNVTIKEVTALPTLMRWRAEVIESVFGEKPSKRLLVANRQYYLRHIADGSHIAVVAETVDGCGVGCGAICLTDELPSPDNPSGRCAYLMIYMSVRNTAAGEWPVLLWSASSRKRVNWAATRYILKQPTPVVRYIKA